MSDAARASKPTQIPVIRASFTSRPPILSLRHAVGYSIEEVGVGHSEGKGQHQGGLQLHSARRLDRALTLSSSDRLR